MVESHCEMMWAENYGVYLWRHPTENCAVGLYDASNQEVIYQQQLRFNILDLLIKNSLITNSKRNPRAFKYAYDFNSQDDGAEILFGIVKIV